MLSRAPSIPAAIRAAIASGVEEAGPIVATILVRRTCISGPQLVAREGAPARVDGLVAELVLDPQQLVVFGGAIGARGCSGLDLTAAGGNGDVRNRRILGFARAVRDDSGVAAPLRELDR